MANTLPNINTSMAFCACTPVKKEHLLTGLRQWRFPPRVQQYKCLGDKWTQGDENTAPPPQ